MRAIALTLAACVFAQAALAHAEPPKPTNIFEEEEASIPTQPSAPPALLRQAPVDPFLCERHYIYQGKRLPCDSNVRVDGEGLRPLLESVPAAVDELNEYQRERRNLRRAAYIGSAGLLLSIVGQLVSLRLRGPDGNVSQTGLDLRSATFFEGLLFAGGSVAYGITTNQRSEVHLGQAVQYFNAAHPGTPIELQFSTGFTF
jgi:hypothetical protein